MAGDSEIEACSSDELDGQTLSALRILLDEAFDARFDEVDFEHSLGGTHLLVRRDGLLLAHAAVVPRRLHVGDRVLACGYLEAVATAPSHQRRGLGSAVVPAAGDLIRAGYAIGALSTSAKGFYAGLGWRPWAGPSYVVDGATWTRTPDEDDGVMVLDVGDDAIDVTARIAVDRRSGDSW